MALNAVSLASAHGWAYRSGISLLQGKTAVLEYSTQLHNIKKQFGYFGGVFSPLMKVETTEFG